MEGAPVILHEMEEPRLEDGNWQGWYQGVLDHGFVELVRWSPDRPPGGQVESWLEAEAMDLDVANSARVSTRSQSPRLGDADRGIINAMMRDHHGTPFEHQITTWRVRCPLFVMREWHRHRTASISEASARYTIVPELFYVPEVEDMRSQVGKAIDYTYEAMDPAKAELWRREMSRHGERSFERYNQAIKDGVAKEVARTLLPVSMYSEMRWTVNVRNLMGFLGLRNAAPAQREIRAYAEVMEEMWAKVMPVTAAAFVKHGRVKP